MGGGGVQCMARPLRVEVPQAVPFVISSPAESSLDAIVAPALSAALYWSSHLLHHTYAIHHI